jgi:biotin transport system substrate-specific component
MTAVLTVCAWVSVPMGDIAISMQTLGMLLCLGMLGGRRGSLVIALYLLLGTVGLPVFSGMQGGLGILLGPTGGYLWGFLLGSLLFWAVEGSLPLWLSMVLSLIVCYVCGTVWYSVMFLQGGIWLVLAKCVVPYLLPDGVKLVLALGLTRRLKKFT